MKKKLDSEQKRGLEETQIRTAELYLNVHGNTPISNLDAAPMLEAFLVGYSIDEVADRYPNFNRQQLIYTAAVNGWVKKREEVAASIYDRVRSKLVRSVVEQVDYMTDLLSVVTVESKSQIAAYLQDPIANPPPQNRIRSIKEYKDAIESLMKLTEKISVMGSSRDSAVDSSKRKPKAKIEFNHSSKEAATLAILAGDDTDD